MSDLISRSALLDAMPKNDEISSFKVRMVICDAPAVDAEPVRHGLWLESNPMFKGIYQCSVCGNYAAMTNGALVDGRNDYYCPNCGAKMDGKECVPRKCGTCSNDGWDMPQCRECNEENGFKWYKRKMDTEVQNG